MKEITLITWFKQNILGITAKKSLKRSLKMKQPRSEKVDFLGQPFRISTCPRCKVEYEHNHFDTNNVCARCLNNVESEDNEDNV